MEHNLDINPKKVIAGAESLFSKFITQDFIISLAISLFLVLVAKVISSKLKRNAESKLKDIGGKLWYRPALVALKNLSFPISGFLLFLGYSGIADFFDFSNKVPSIISNLLLAWIVLSFATAMLGNGFLVKVIKIIVLVSVGLNILGVLDQVTEFLSNITFSLNEKKISLYDVMKGVSIFLILLWVTFFISSKAEIKIKKSKGLTPSLKVLISKLTKITLFTCAILIGLTSIGLDLTVFAVFGGAVGVGVGFGLQKIISNFISGIILLSDRSIKPGDVIAVGKTFGWVNSLSARYVSIITRDGKEHLIPNESLITERVENWSFSNSEIRIKVPFGVSYKSNVPEVIELALKSSVDTGRILKFPEPKCLLIGFGDNSIDFELRLWINDPANGIANIKSDVLLNLWKSFDENNIEIPFPQRDIHIISDETKK